MVEMIEGPCRDNQKLVCQGNFLEILQDLMQELYYKMVEDD
jgi:hypothetical protein